MPKKTTFLALGMLGLGAGAYALLRRRALPLPDHPFLDLPTPIVMAHRGGQGLWPPNSLFAFQQAVALGVDVLEMDIHSTADGVLVVRHDPTVDATTNGSGFIQDMTLAEIKALDAGYTWSSDGEQTFPFRDQGITIPTLEEVLSALPTTRLNIDIKPEDPAVVGSFCRLLRDTGSLERVLVGSFHDPQLRLFRQLCPQVATVAGVQETSVFFGLVSAFLADAYQGRAEAFSIPEYQRRLHVVTPRFIRAAHAHNMQVHIWTVNELADMRRLLDWGVDCLITDYPDRLLGLLGRM
jgi:glycerophosphoryl diester phosphodiesterase